MLLALPISWDVIIRLATSRRMTIWDIVLSFAEKQVETQNQVLMRSANRAYYAQLALTVTGQFIQDKAC